MIPKRFPKLTYPKIFARNAAGKIISPTLAIARMVRQTRPWVSAASAGRRQLRSTQTRKTDRTQHLAEKYEPGQHRERRREYSELTNEIHDDDRIEDWIRITYPVAVEEPVRLG